MIHVASYLVAAAALIILIKRSRDTREHAVIVTMFRDRTALAVGGVWTIGPLITDFVKHGFLEMWNGLVGTLVGGFIATAIVHLMSKRRNAAKS